MTATTNKQHEQRNKQIEKRYFFMTYVYGYEIRAKEYEENFRVVSKGNRNVIVSKEPLTDKQVVEKVIHRITFASCCKSSFTKEERLQKTRKMFEIRNVQLVRTY